MDGDWLRDMGLFVAVGQERSFGRAAAALGMPSSTLSRRIAALEKELGLRLLNRSTRRVELTEEGATYLARAERIVEEARMAYEDLRDRKTKPRGHLRISIPLRLAEAVAVHWFAEFARLYPDLTFEFDTAQTRLEMIADHFDAALVFGALPDSQLNVRRVTSGVTLSLFAAPSYLAGREPPAHPRDLAQHDCVRLTQLGDSWSLTNGREQVTINITGRFTCDNGSLILPLAVDGMGIVLLFDPLGDAEVTNGRLARVLPGWHPVETYLSIITPSRLMPAKTRVLIDFLTAKLRTVTSGPGGTIAPDPAVTRGARAAPDIKPPP
jgi:DNA-binding transcriptional LysR family regulator